MVILVGICLVILGGIVGYTIGFYVGHYTGRLDKSIETPTKQKTVKIVPTPKPSSN